MTSKTQDKTTVSNAVRVALQTPHYEVIVTEDFLDLEPINNQRNEGKRHGKVRRRIKDKKYGTIGIVHIAELPSGRRYVIDGNTRALVWRMALNGEGLTKVNVPTEVHAIVWKVKNLREARELYYTIDNSGAAEGGSDKITGYFRLAGIHPNSFKNSFLRGGTIGKALDTLLAKNPSTCEDREDVVDEFKKEILDIDETSIGKLKFRNVMLAASILFIRKNPEYKESVLDLIEDLALGATFQRFIDRENNTWKDTAAKRLQDAYNGQCKNGTAQSNENEWIVSGNNNNFTAQVGFVLYLLDLHVQDKTLKSTISEKKGSDYFNAF